MGGARSGSGEVENPCPICLVNEDNACVDRHSPAFCTFCGQLYCGACNTTEKIGQVQSCPTCRAPIVESKDENFKRCWKLVHDRTPGRHTPFAQCALGYSYSKGLGVPQDHKEAVRFYQLSADQGHADAQNNLGVMYEKGNGVAQGHKEAVGLYQLAAAQGHAGGQCSLGYMYGRGVGVPQDHKEAARFFQLAADQGHADAQSNLGAIYGEGRGVPKDDKEAARFFRLAADQGYAQAQYNLGAMYYNGHGALVPQDHAEAARLYRLAADQGLAGAQYNLGAMHVNGLGVPKDYTEAGRLLQFAAVQGYSPAISALDQLQEANILPLPPQGAAVTTILLTSAASSRYNSRSGRVAARTADVKPGRVAVLLDGEVKVISFKVKNIQWQAVANLVVTL